LTQTGSISKLLSQLKREEALAAQGLWERYAKRLVSLARRRLRGVSGRLRDEEDIALSVFNCLCRGAAAGRFEDLKNRDDLWWLLLRLTQQKAADYYRLEFAQKRGGKSRRSAGDPREFNRTGLATVEQLISREPTPEFVATLEDEQRRLLQLLRNDQLREVALKRIEGYTVVEIADKLNLSTRSIERKLQVIRDTWATELQHD
jgi:DNA-directed RNA polymerase specialized sigma24 family protein